MGDKVDNCRKGVQGLQTSGKSLLIEQSPHYRTSPVDFTNQGWFVNAVVKIDTSLDPFELLDELISVQRGLGQGEKPIRFGPRILDLDIIFFNETVIRSSKLDIPHPRMHKRRFVLQPICDIDPLLVHPVLKKNMRDLLNDIEDPTQEVIRI
jgi:2-amino-4-hydroxy-6-hydroxymethyldihydropteridine diphosphokinase